MIGRTVKEMFITLICLFSSICFAMDNKTNKSSDPALLPKIIAIEPNSKINDIIQINKDNPNTPLFLTENSIDFTDPEFKKLLAMFGLPDKELKNLDDLKKEDE